MKNIAKNLLLVFIVSMGSAVAAASEEVALVADPTVNQVSVDLSEAVVADAALAISADPELPPATLDTLISEEELEEDDEENGFTIVNEGSSLLSQQDAAVLLDDFVLDEQVIIDADSTINGLGNKLIFTGEGRLVIGAGVTVTLKNIILSGLSNDHIVFNAQDSLLCLSDVQIRLASDVCLDEGALVIDGDVSIRSPFIFQHDSVGGITIEPNSRLFMDLGTTLKPLTLTFNDNVTSELYLNGAALNAGPAGLVINRGVVVCANRVLLSAEGETQEKGLYMGDNALVKILAGARVERHGYVSLT